LGDRLNLFAEAREVHLTATELSDQAGRSVKEAGLVGGGPANYAAAMKAAVDPVVAAATEIRDLAFRAAQEPVLDPSALNAKLDRMVPVIQRFYNDQVISLGFMIDHRIATDTSEMVTAFVVAIAGLVVGLFVLVVVVVGIRRRTRQLIEALGSVAQGDLTRPIPGRLLASQDELGQLAQSVTVLQRDLKEQVLSLGSVTQRLSEMGSTLSANTEESAAAIEEMSATSSQVAKFAGGQLEQTTQARGEIDEILNQITGSNELTQGMATHFFMFSQSMEANRLRIRTTAHEARRTGELTTALTVTGHQGEQSLEALRQSIRGVAVKTKAVQEIVLFILDIADRTNLLSMNAAIEAAHAGTSGRGFAVVADEIRKLAETSSKQAQSIKALVDGISEAATVTLAKSEQTSDSFKSVLRDIEAVQDASQSIARQMVLQEDEDTKLSGGLEEFTRFYGDLSGSMEQQVTQSATVQRAVVTLGQSAEHISQSMEEQKIGMEQATEAVVQVRDATVVLSQILNDLKELMDRFKT